MQKRETLTVRQTAIRLGCTLKYIFDLLYAGKLAGARKRERQWQIPVSAVEERLKRQVVRRG